MQPLILGTGENQITITDTKIGIIIEEEMIGLLQKYQDLKKERSELTVYSMSELSSLGTLQAKAKELEKERDSIIALPKTNDARLTEYYNNKLIAIDKKMDEVLAKIEDLKAATDNEEFMAKYKEKSSKENTAKYFKVVKELRATGIEIAKVFLIKQKLESEKKVDLILHPDNLGVDDKGVGQIDALISAIVSNPERVDWALVFFLLIQN
jgi:hypothetical protein